MALSSERRSRPGVGFWCFFLGYNLIRVVVGFFRQDTIVAWGLGQAQLLGLLAVPMALAMLAFLMRERRPAPTTGRT